MQNALVIVVARTAWGFPFVGVLVASSALEEENAGIGCNSRVHHESACRDVAEGRTWASGKIGSLGDGEFCDGRMVIEDDTGRSAIVGELSNICNIC